LKLNKHINEMQEIISQKDKIIEDLKQKHNEKF
jgi:hypothetical protein